MRVSVPFRGISFPNITNVTLTNYELAFPSPSGASHFQIENHMNGATPVVCFRPLPGHLISKWRKSTLTMAGVLSFRPLPGHLISK